MSLIPQHCHRCFFMIVWKLLCSFDFSFWIILGYVSETMTDRTKVIIKSEKKDSFVKIFPL
jgi:hypothetical protein